MLTRDQILQAGFRSEVVETRIGDFRVRVMSAATRELFERTINASRDECMIRSHWLRLTLCDDEGALMFSDEDVPALARLDADVVIQVFGVALALNGMAPDSVEKAEKN